MLEPLLQLSPLLRLLALLAGVPGSETLVSAWPTTAAPLAGDVACVLASNIDPVADVGDATLTSTSSMGRCSSSQTGEQRSSNTRLRRSAMASGESLVLLAGGGAAARTVGEMACTTSWPGDGGASVCGVSRLVSVPWSTRKWLPTDVGAAATPAAGSSGV